jgi:hypothetical protein
MTILAKLTDRFSEADVDDEVVVMRLDTGEFYSLSGTAAAIWRLIDGQRDRASLIAALADEFEGDDAAIATDVDEFVARMRDMGLLAEG